MTDSSHIDVPVKRIKAPEDSALEQATNEVAMTDEPTKQVGDATNILSSRCSSLPKHVNLKRRATKFNQSFSETSIRGHRSIAASNGTRRATALV